MGKRTEGEVIRSRRRSKVSHHHLSLNCLHHSAHMFWWRKEQFGFSLVPNTLLTLSPFSLPYLLTIHSEVLVLSVAMVSVKVLQVDVQIIISWSTEFSGVKYFPQVISHRCWHTRTHTLWGEMMNRFVAQPEFSIRWVEISKALFVLHPRSAHSSTFV